MFYGQFHLIACAIELQPTMRAVFSESDGVHRKIVNDSRGAVD
jgi:hypothetical protein